MNNYNDIKNGKITFEKAVSQYSEDKSSSTSGGEIGWLSIDDNDTLSYMGENFFNEVFKLDAGEVSKVIESLAGYHIVKVTVHNDLKFLGLDDTVSPADTMTVREYIYNYLANENYSIIFQKAYIAIIDELRAVASIKYL